MDGLIASVNINKEDLSKLDNLEAKAGKVGKEKLVRSTIDLSKSMHKEIKLKAAQKEITIREYMINLIEEDLYGQRK